MEEKREINMSIGIKITGPGIFINLCLGDETAYDDVHHHQVIQSIFPPASEQGQRLLL